MRKLFVLVFALATLGANSMATAKPMTSQEVQCFTSFKNCTNKCGPDNNPCDTACYQTEEKCKKPGAKSISVASL